MTVSTENALRDAIGLGAALSFVSDYVANMGYHNSDQMIIPLDIEDKTISYYLMCFVNSLNTAPISPSIHMLLFSISPGQNASP